VLTVAFSPDGQTLASGSRDRTIKHWRVSDGALLRTLAGHTSLVVSVAFAPDGQTLASAAGEFPTHAVEIKLWRVSDGTPLKTYDEETGTGVFTLSMNPDGRSFAYGRADATIVLARNPYGHWPGDLNCDAAADGFDIEPFFLALEDPAAYQAKFPDCDILNGDLNADGETDGFDIEPFFALLQG
jgi:WD40 repeat protein